LFALILLITLWQVIIAITIVSIGIIVIGVKLSSHSKRKAESYFVVTNRGVIFFPETLESYQLSIKTRVSFFALWLELEPLSNESISKLSKQKLLASTKSLFLFRDSLTRQDFSNLLSVIREL
jgi:hypothetical protein